MKICEDPESITCIQTVFTCIHCKRLQRDPKNIRRSCFRGLEPIPTVVKNNLAYSSYNFTLLSKSVFEKSFGFFGRPSFLPWQLCRSSVDFDLAGLTELER